MDFDPLSVVEPDTLTRWSHTVELTLEEKQRELQFEKREILPPLAEPSKSIPGGKPKRTEKTKPREEDKFLYIDDEEASKKVEEVDKAFVDNPAPEPEPEPIENPADILIEDSNSSKDGVEQPDTTTTTEPLPQEVRFPYDDDLNQKIILWKGNLTKLRTSAIVNTTNERMTSETGVSKVILDAAGPELMQEYRNSERCRTGEAGICKGYNLIAPNVIHTVGPRYNIKYKIAAQNALHGCYRNCLELMLEHKLESIAFCVINTPEKGYPLEDAAHIAVRTLRRFLQMYGDPIKTVVLCMSNWRDLRIYRDTMKLYFPRNLIEQDRAQDLLPAYTGNEVGETVIADRKIRITGRVTSSGEYVANPFNTTVERKNKNVPYTYYTDEIFTEMKETPDEIRRIAELSKPKEQIEWERIEREYSQKLKQSRKEGDFSEYSMLNFLYSSGIDSAGRPIIVFIGSQFPGDLPESELDRIMLYIIRTLDGIVTKEYVLVYVHTDIQPENKPGIHWIRKSWTSLAHKYRKNMKQFFVVHPSVWVKVVLWILAPMVKQSFWRKLVYIHELKDIYNSFDPDQLKLPDHCYLHDAIMNGSVWSEANGSLAGHDRL